MNKKRSFIELINRKPGTGAEYLPKAAIKDEQEPDKSPNQQNESLASLPIDRSVNESSTSLMVESHSTPLNQNAEIWQATGKPENDRLASSGLPKELPANHHEQKVASQQTVLLASQTNESMASRKYARRSNRIAMTVRYSSEIYKEIKRFCEQSGVEIQDFCEMAASFYLDAAGQKSEKVASQNEQLLASQTAPKVASWLAHDDLMIFKTHDDIIMLYRKLTNRKWTASDDRAAAKLNNTDRRLIEIGMIHTVLNARGKKINSFAYFIPEIELLANLHIDNSHLDAYLRARRESLAKWLQKQRGEKKGEEK